MQLSRKSSARLEKLIDALLVYCVKERRPELLSEDKLKEGTLPAAADIVWADDGDLTLIDTFVKTNPAKLNRTDLRQVFSWKKALRGDFCFCRHGKDTVLLAGDYAFCVRGTDEELDSAYSEFPMYALTVILPFDGVLAHIGYAGIAPIEEDLDAWNQKLLSAVDFIAGHHNLIRTERQFLQVAEDIELGDRPYLPTLVSGSTDAGGEADIPGEGSLQKRGVLSGLTFEERERRVQAHRKQRQEEALRRCAIHAKPCTSYYEILLCYGRETLRSIAWEENLVLDSNELLGMTEEELAETITCEQYFSTENIIDYATWAGHEMLELLRDLYDAGGSMRVDLAGLNLEEWQLEELTYVLHLFEYEDRYYLVIPSDVKTELACVNWEEHIARSKRIDDAIDRLMCALHFRGAVMLRSAMAQLIDIDNPRPGFARDVEAFRDTLLARIVHGAVHAHIVYTRDFTKPEGTEDGEETAYVVPPSVYYNLDVYSNGIVAEYEHDIEVLITRAMEPNVKPVPELTWHDYLTQLPSYRAAVAFLDAHIALGYEDHEYADYTVNQLSTHVQTYGDDVASIVQALSNCGGADGPKQQAALTRILKNLARDLPRWRDGGYSIAEMAAAGKR